MTGSMRQPEPRPVAPSARPLPRPMAPPPPPRPVRATVPGPPPGPVAPLDLEKLLAARLHAVAVRPYLASALFALHVVEDRSVPTMAVDAHWRCYVSPSFVARTPLEELAGVWVHEVSHLLRDHHERSVRYAREQGRAGPGSGCGRTSRRTSRSTTTSTVTAFRCRRGRYGRRCWACRTGC